MDGEAEVCPTCNNAKQQGPFKSPVELQKPDIGGFMKSEAYDFRSLILCFILSLNVLYSLLKDIKQKKHNCKAVGKLEHLK